MIRYVLTNFISYILNRKNNDNQIFLVLFCFLDENALKKSVYLVKMFSHSAARFTRRAHYLDASFFYLITKSKSQFNISVYFFTENISIQYWP